MTEFTFSVSLCFCVRSFFISLTAAERRFAMFAEAVPRIGRGLRLTLQQIDEQAVDGVFHADMTGRGAVLCRQGEKNRRGRDRLRGRPACRPWDLPVRRVQRHEDRVRTVVRNRGVPVRRDHF